jgi:micrococcal nuclease
MKALLIAALLLIPALTLAQEVQVVRTVDGDTIKVMYKGVEEPVRLIGVDTPEAGQPGYHNASEYTAYLVDDKVVRLEFDKTLQDKYGRLLAYVYLPDGRMLNEELIRARHSGVYTKYPFKYLMRFKSVERPVLRGKRE